MNTLRFVLTASVLALSGCSVLVPSFDRKTSEVPPPPPVVQQTTAEKAAWPGTCELFNAEEELGEFKKTLEISGKCSWARDEGGGRSSILDLNVYELTTADEGPQDTDAETSDITVGEHKGKQVEETESSGGCSIWLNAAKGHVTIRAMSLARDSCQLAKQVAEKVEPKLPA